MALFNIFKKKPASAKATAGEGKKVAPKKLVEKKIEPAAVSLKPKRVSEEAGRILKWPHVTEKATDLTKIDQYVFNVYERTNKPEIKKAVEDVYGVKVTAIKIVKIPPKKRRLGRVEGWRKGYKKAIVKLAQGQKIEILPK